MKYPVKVGILGGTGMNCLNVLENAVEKHVTNIYGNSSDILLEGTIQNVKCAILPRHGKCHSIMPTNVNYRANTWALKMAGCTHILATTACGSLKEDLKPGDIVFIDSFIDRTKSRSSTFYDPSINPSLGLCYLPMEPAFCKETRKILADCAQKLNLRHQTSGTCVTIEGPRFSSLAESNLYRSWGCDVINMTLFPEVVLAKEAGLCYASIALITDYDCWNKERGVVNSNEVIKEFNRNISNVMKLICEAVVEIGKKNWDEVIDSLKEEIASNTIGKG